MKKQRSARAALIAAGFFSVCGGIAVGQETGVSSPTQGSTSSPLDMNALPDLKSLPWNQAALAVSAAREEARRAMTEGRGAWAGARLSQIAQLLPLSPDSADAWFMAGVAYGRANQFDDARAACDQAVSTCKRLLVIDYSDPPSYAQGTPYPDSLRDLLRRSLRQKAQMFRNAGQFQEALRVIQQFRAEEPEYHYLRKILPLQAEVAGVALPALDENEAASHMLADQAKWAGDKGDREHAIQFAERAITQYPQTGGSLLARGTEARVLYRAKQFDRARQLYQGLVDDLEPIAPTCDLVREARAKLAYQDCVPQIRAIISKYWSNSAPSPFEWDELRTNCRRVMSDEATPVTRAAGFAVYIESFHYQHDDAAVLNEGQRFLTLHNSRENANDPEYKHVILWIHLYMAAARMGLDRYEEAIRTYRTIIANYADDPHRWDKGSCLPNAYFGLWKALQASGVSADQAQLEVAPLLKEGRRESFVVQQIWGGQKDRR